MKNEICCDAFRALIPDLKWFTPDEGKTILMPCIGKYRVNYCPSCGAYIRQIHIEK